VATTRESANFTPEQIAGFRAWLAEIRPVLEDHYIVIRPDGIARPFAAGGSAARKRRGNGE
jgi:hypothetical protein